MKNQSYTTAITIASNPEHIFECIAAIPKWCTKDFKGSSCKLHDEFVICHPGAHYSKQQVIEVVPGKKIVWLVTESELSWLEKDKSEWTGTRMVFKLTPADDKTRIEFTHEGLVPGAESYDRCRQGWDLVIKNRLFHFISGQLANYTVSIEVEKSPDEVFGHIINDIPKFWPEEFEGASRKLGDEFVFRSEGGHYSKNFVTEFMPGKRLVWLVTESIRKTDNFDWTGSKMIFELTPKGDGTQLEFTYDGIVQDGEYDRLAMVCDMVIKENLYNLLTQN